MKSLEYLVLNNTKVTDAGMVHLQKMARLKTLDLSNTKVTDAAAAKLQKSLPNCRIWHGERRDY
jgi:hypothetical protein